MRALAAAWLREQPARPRTAALRIDAVAVVVDDRGALVALEQFEDVALSGYSASCWYAVDWNDIRCSGETPSRAIAARCSGVE